MKYPNIEKSTTIVSNIRNKKRLISYFTSSKEIIIKDLISYLNERLAPYMVPYKLMQLDSLPITSNGKVDKKALPMPTIEDKNEYVKPENDTQTKLHNIWCSLFNLDRISINDDFFKLGGDSLLSIKLTSRIYEQFNVKISIKQIFNNPTIKTLSEVVDSLSPEDLAKPISKQTEKDFYSISSAQKRMYLSSHMDKNSTLYNIYGGILLDSMPNINKLQSALDLIVSRHESLRTYFEIVNRPNRTKNNR